MKPINIKYLEWLDKDGNLREDTPKIIRDEYEGYRKHYAEWRRELLEVLTSSGDS